MAGEKLSVEQKLETEKKGIKLVMLGDILMAALGLTLYYLTNSQAILMDGIYPFIDLVAALLTLRVVSLMAMQANQSQPFGYAIFEPVLNFIKGILILLLILFALYAAIEAILNGGRLIEADIAVFYSIVASALGFALSYVLYRMNKKAQSSLIDVDLKGWLIGAILSVAVGISFAVEIWMHSVGLTVWAMYTDPIVILVLIMLMLPMPIQILRDNGLQIIGRSGSSEMANTIEKHINKSIEHIDYEDMKLRYLKIGRMVYVQVYIQLDALAMREQGFDLFAQDVLREQMYEDLNQTYDYLSLDVFYTAQPIWSATGRGTE